MSEENTPIEIKDIIDDSPIEDKKTEEIIESKSNKPNATLRDQYSTEYSKDDKGLFFYKFSLPSVPLDALNNIDFSSIDDKDPKSVQWKNVLSDSVDQYTPSGLYQSRFREENSKFYQGILHQDDLIQSGSVKTKDKVGELRGDVAILKIAKHLGLGELVRVPLYHSGLWLTFKPPAEADLIDFYNNLLREKITLGRETQGYTLSNFSTITNDELVDFAIAHVHSTNVKDLNISSLKSYINIHDLPILAWGFASSFYPDGFDFSRPCMNVEENCTYVSHEKLSMHKLLWVDNNALTPYQKEYMADYRSNKRTLDEFIKYKNDSNRLKGLTVKHNNIKFNLKQATIEEHVDIGLKWINGITKVIEDQLINNNDEKDLSKKRIELINQYVKVSILRQYAHFIESIEIDDNIITDRDTVDKALELFSASDDVREFLLKEIGQFIEKSTIAIIGIPTYKCPACGKLQNDPTLPENLTDVIPLDVVSLFFGLITLRASVILARQ